MPESTSPPRDRTARTRDLRRAISPQVWLGNRARNALRRPVFIGAISVGTFVTAIVSMVVVPRAQPAPAAVPMAPRPDTLGLIGTSALGRRQLAAAESALVVARDEGRRLEAEAAAAQAAFAADTLAGQTAVRDSIRRAVDQLTAFIARAEQAPLASSYRALASVPELRTNPRIRALADSLTDVEREREGFGAVGGVDPIFVALTSRANEIGRSIVAIAATQRDQMAQALGPAPAVMEVAAAATPDTLPLLAARDSIQNALREADAELERRRARARELDLAEERARERASAVAPPLALLAAAFVLSAVIGFAVAFLSEVRRPRVSDAPEVERFLGIRVLATIETPMPSVDRGRREADRTAPPYFDPGAEGYQLTYLGLATEHPTLLLTTVTGDDPTIAAVVACNLAAVAADEARGTMVLDLEPSCRASAALRARSAPGVLDVLRGDAAWPEATVSAQVGRGKTVDLVPCGAGTMPDGEQLIARVRDDAARLARYYDAIFVVASPEMASGGLPAALPSPDLIFCAQPSLTPLRELKQQLAQIREAGATIRGVVLWNAERPLLPTPRALARRTASARETTAAGPSQRAGANAP